MSLAAKCFGEFFVPSRFQQTCSTTTSTARSATVPTQQAERFHPSEQNAHNTAAEARDTTTTQPEIRMRSFPHATLTASDGWFSYVHAAVVWLTPPVAPRPWWCRGTHAGVDLPAPHRVRAREAQPSAGSRSDDPRCATAVPGGATQKRH